VKDNKDHSITIFVLSLLLTLQNLSMKKIYFQKKFNMMDFILLCKHNKIEFNIPKNTGTLLCVEIPDDFKSDSFLLINGFEE